MARHVLVTTLIAVSIAGCLGGQSSGSTASTPGELPPDRSARASTGAEEPARRDEAAEREEPAGRAEPAETDEPAGRPEVSSPDREIVQSLAGVWQLAETDAEEQTDRAIADVTGQMSFFARGFANARIDEAVNPDERVRIEPAGDDIVVAVGRGRPVRLVPNGPAVRGTGADGQPLRARAILRGDALSIEEETERGTRILTLRPRGDALVVTTRIRSERLPDDIVYDLRYRRAGAGEVARR